MKKEFIADKCRELHMSEQEVIQFVNLSINETSIVMPLLQQAVHDGNYIEIQSISHRVKTNLFNLKFDYLGSLAQDINLSSFLKTDIQSIREKFEQLKNGFEVLSYEITEE